jgi:hypothetical protein
MKGSIYLNSNDKLIEMEKEPYEYEDLLQEMLATYPRLLAGDQMADNDSLRWLLIAREAAVPDSRGGTGRWSADHLFVDQNGVPTIVEVKRGENTQVRREIVGQILDYAAHASLHLEAETLRSRYVETCEDRGLDPDEQLAHLLDGEDVTEFWHHVETNFRSKRIRLLFVADDIPSELKRVVEFLNESMDDVDVFAIEVSQYTSDNDQAFVPRLYGQTEEARATSSSSSSRTGNEYVESEQELFDDLERKLDHGDISQSTYEAFIELYEFAKEIGDDIDISGAKNANFGLQVYAHQGDYNASPSVFTANVSGKVKIWPAKMVFGDDLAHPAPVSWEPTAYQQFQEDFGALEGVPDDESSVRFEALTRGGNLAQFKQSVTEFVSHCRDAAAEESSE